MKAKRAIYIHDLLFLDYPEYFSKKELFYYQFMVKFSRKADLFITPSVSEKDRMIKHNLGTNKNIHAIHHGLSSKFIPKQKYSPLELKATREKLNLSEYYILYVGRVNVRKNLLNLVKALPAIKDTSIKLVIVGKADSDNSAIHTFITEHNLTDRVLFTGHVDEADLFKIYALAFVFCFPSFAEGFGLPPVEAMQCAIPCVVSNRTSLPEVCGDAGVYINPDDPWDIAEKLNLLIGNREFYQTIRAKSLEQAKKFSWSVAADQILNILVSYCDNGKNY